MHTRVAWTIAIGFGLTASTPGVAEPGLRLVPQTGHYNFDGFVFSPDGTLLVSEHDDRAVVWDVATGTTVREWIWGYNEARVPRFTPDGRQVITCHSDGTLRFVDLESGETVQTIAPRARLPCIDVALSRDGAFVGSATVGGLQVWSVADGTPLHAPSGDYFLSFSSDGHTLFGGTGWGWRPHLADLRWGTEIPLTGHRRGPRNERFDVDGLFSPDGSKLLTFGEDGRAFLRDGQTGAIRFRWSAPHGPIRAAAWAPDGRTVLTGYESGAIVVWDAVSGGLRTTLLQHPGAVVSIDFSVEGDAVVTAADRGPGFVWDPTSWIPRFELELGEDEDGLDHRATLARFAPTSDRIAVADRGGISLFDSATGRWIDRLTHRAPDVYSDDAVAVSPRREFLAKADCRQGILVQPLRGGRSPQRWRFVEDKVPISDWMVMQDCARLVAFSHDGQRLVGANQDATVWNVGTGEPVSRIDRREGFIRSVRFSADDTLIVTASSLGGAAVWNAATGQREIGIIAADGPLIDASLAPNGKDVLTRPSEGRPRVWSVATGEPRFSIGERGESFDDAEYSPDGSTIVTVGPRSADVWDAETGAHRHALVGHDGYNRTAEFSPNGQWIATAGWDGSAAIWSAATGERLHRLPHDSKYVDYASFSHDGNRLVTLRHERAAVWNSRTGALIQSFPLERPCLSAYFLSNERLVLTAVDGTMTVWDVPTGDRLVTLLSFTDGTWAAVDPAGRFDTSDIGALTGATWVRDQDPLYPLLLTSFAREFYTPGLFQRIIAGESLPSIPDLSTLDVRAPVVSLRTESDPEPLAVVDVCPPDPRPADPESTWAGAQDLRLLLDGRLVGWVDGPLGAGCSTHRLPLPFGATSKRLTAYAFNTQHVKSRDVTIDVSPPATGPVTRRAFIVNVGVNDYAEDGFSDLRWAGADATALRDALAEIPGHEVHRVLLTDRALSLSAEPDGGAALPTRDNLQSVLAALSGGPPPAFARDFTTARPDDVVIVTFAGHGWAPSRPQPDGTRAPGPFHLMLSDLGRPPGGGPEAALPYAVSEEELAAWFKPIRAGELALIVDACQAASSVEGEEFRPGPLGSRGFGQLAYDKGMLVLAASQADAVALESSSLQHGLLTWALVEDGLRAGRADGDRDGSIALREWLTYAEARVPQLAGLVARGEPVGEARAVVGRGLAVIGGSVPPPAVAQQPRLFAFKDAGSVTLAQSAPGP